jgi:hypothetical protein
MSFHDIQSRISQYVRRVYGPDAEASNAIPIGKGTWQFYVNYPKGRAFIVKLPHSKLAQKTSNDVSRHYEYYVYSKPRFEGKGEKAENLYRAKQIAKKLGTPAAIYSVQKGRFIGYIGPRGKFVVFR